MRIPEKLRSNSRYFVATSDTHAFSSWSTFEDARESIERFKDAADTEKHYYKDDFSKIKGIIEVTPQGKTWVFDLEKPVKN